MWQTGAGTEYSWNGTSYATQAALFAATRQEAKGLFADPKFVSLAGGNFQLTAGSPAIDSADSAATGEQTTDLAGHPRVDDPTTPNTGAGPRTYDDRGAYEYQPPPPVGPTAHLTVTPTTGTAPLGVTADASTSTAGSSAILSYTFAFGDGTTVGPQPGKTATHTYAAAGNYTVTVTVTDANALTSTATQQVSVSPVVGPTAHLTVTPTTGTAPLGVTADASTSTAGSSAILSYTFAFGDGTTVGPQPGKTATHTYAAAGNYTVTVTVTDANTLTSTATQQVTVSPSAPVISGFVPGNGLPGMSVVISGGQFTGATGVGFNGTAAVSFTVDSDAQVTATVPVGATSGPITVTTGAGTATSVGSFTVGCANGAVAGAVLPEPVVVGGAGGVDV